MPSEPAPHVLPSSPTSRAEIPWHQISLFILITLVVTWLVALPLYLADVTTVQALYLPLSLVMMGMPALVAWLIVRRTRPKGQRAATLGFNRHRPLPRFFVYLVLAFLLPIVIALLSLPIASAMGLYDADLTNFAGLQQLFADAGVTGMPVEIILVNQVINVVLAAWFINLIPALGEEIGWRGWLTPQLLPLGVLPTIGITGVIWGLWHTPLILLGHNYPHLPGWQAVVFMVMFCTLIGGILAWLTIRTNSVWPAALGHSTINAIGALPLLFSAEPTFDSAHVGITGTTGWIVAAVILVVLLAIKSFKPAPTPTIDPATAWPDDYQAETQHHPDAK